LLIIVINLAAVALTYLVYQRKDFAI